MTFLDLTLAKVVDVTEALMTQCFITKKKLFGNRAKVNLGVMVAGIGYHTTQ